MKSKQDFEKAWGAHKGERYEVGFAVTDALEVMEALEAQIPKARFKVGDRVKYEVLERIEGCVSEVRMAFIYSLQGHTGGGFDERVLEPAPIEPPTAEEFYLALQHCRTNTFAAEIVDRYERWKESQNG